MCVALTCRCTCFHAEQERRIKYDIAFLRGFRHGKVFPLFHNFHNLLASINIILQVHETASYVTFFRVLKKC